MYCCRKKKKKVGDSRVVSTEALRAWHVDDRIPCSDVKSDAGELLVGSEAIK